MTTEAQFRVTMGPDRQAVITRIGRRHRKRPDDVWEVETFDRYRRGQVRLTYRRTLTAAVRCVWRFYRG